MVGGSVDTVLNPLLKATQALCMELRIKFHAADHCEMTRMVLLCAAMHFCL